eukprot:c26615_g1_i1 orf=569-1747(+)
MAQVLSLLVNCGVGLSNCNAAAVDSNIAATLGSQSDFLSKGRSRRANASGVQPSRKTTILRRGTCLTKEHIQFGIRVKALQREGSDGHDDQSELAVPASETVTWTQGHPLNERYEANPFWVQSSLFIRLCYAAGMYGAMGVAGQVICYLTGIDNLGGFELRAETAMQGLGYAVPPMMVLLFILDDEVVRKSPPARAIRDVEYEELLAFFDGMSPWQFIVVMIMSCVAEEIFFRIAVQGGLAHAFLSDKQISETTNGIAALTGIFPSFAPFAQALAAVLTAALVGSIFYCTSPQDPTYVVAPVMQNCAAQQNIKKCFSAWYERRQLRKIYSPLLDSLLALYLGFEWVQTGNILAPTITHIIYLTVVLGNCLRRVHDQRIKLRQRTESLAKKAC